MEIIISAAVSLLVQFIKKNFGTSEYTTLAVTLGVSLLGALVYTGLKTSGLLEAFFGVLMVASSIYTLIIARFEK